MLASIVRKMGLLPVTVAMALTISSGVALAAGGELTYIKCAGGVVCWGTPSPDHMTGTNDSSDGEFGNWNDMRGREGNDTLLALKGPDKLTGGPGNDSLDGGDDLDTYYFEGDWGSDQLADASGKDMLDFSKLLSRVTVYLQPDSSRNEAQSGMNTLNWSLTVSIEDVLGGSGSDFIYGTNSNNWVRGGSGGDNLWGVYGNDLLEGGDGNDQMNAGPGADTFLGNGGDDSFYAVDRVADKIYCGSGYDTITYDSTLDHVSSDCEIKQAR
jgi:Ca2+-binding RTX toxin-like protein